MNLPNSSCLRKYSIQLSIQKILLRVRFACQVTASFRIGKQEQQFSSQAPLSNNKALLRDSVQVPVTLTRTPSPSIKGEISVYLITDGGRRNIAGMCIIDIVEIIKNPVSRNIVSAITQCPDSGAKIQYRVKAVLLEEKMPERREELSIILHKSDNNSPRPDILGTFVMGSPVRDTVQRHGHFRTPTASSNIQEKPIQSAFPRSSSKSQLQYQFPLALTDNLSTAQKPHSLSQFIQPQLSQKLQQLKKRLQQSQQQLQVQAVRQRNNSSVKIAESKQNHYKVELKKANEKVTEVVMERDRLAGEVEAMRRRVLEAEAKEGKEGKDRRELQRVLEEERSRGNGLRDEVEAGNVENRDLRQRVKEVTSKLEGFQAQMLDRDREKARNIQEIQTVKTQLAKQRLIRSSLEQQLTKHTQTILQLKSSLQQQHQKVLKDTDSVKNSLRNSNISSLRQLQKQSIQIKDLNKKNTDLQRLLGEAQRRYDEEALKNKGIEGDLREKDWEVKRLRERVEVMGRELEVERVGIGKIKGEYQEKEKVMNREFQERISCLQIQLQFFSDQLALERTAQEQQRAKDSHQQECKRQQLVNQYEQKIKQIQQTLNQKIQYLQSKYSKIEKIKEELQNKIMNIQNDIDFKAITNLDNKTAIENLKQRQIFLQNELLVKEEHLKAIKMQYDELFLKFQDSQEKLSQNQLELENVKHQITLLTKQIESNTSDSKLLRGKNDQLTQQIREINKKLAFANAEIEKQKQGAQVLSAQLIAQQKERSALKVQYDQLETNYNSVSDQLDKALKEIRQLQSKPIKPILPVQKHQHSSIDVNKLKEQLRAVTTQRSALKQQLKTHQKQLKSLNQIIYCRDQQLSSLQQQLQSIILTSQQTQTRLQSQLSTLQHSQHSQLTPLQSQLSTLQYKLATRQQQLLTTQNSLNQSSELINKFSTKIKDLMDQYNKSQQQAKQKTLELQRLGNDAAERQVGMKIEIECLKNERRMLEDQYEMERWEKEGVVVREAQLEDELAAVREELRRLKLSSEEAETRLLQIVGNLQVKSPKAVAEIVGKAKVMRPVNMVMCQAFEVIVEPSKDMSPPISPKNREVAELTYKYNEMRNQYQQRIDILRDELQRITSQYQLLLQQPQPTITITKPKPTFSPRPQDYAYRLTTVEEQTGQSLITDLGGSSPNLQDFDSESKLQREIQRLTSQNTAMLGKIQILYEIIQKNKGEGRVQQEREEQAMEIVEESRRMATEKRVLWKY